MILRSNRFRAKLIDAASKFAAKFTNLAGKTYKMHQMYYFNEV